MTSARSHSAGPRTPTERREHWDGVHRTRSGNELSWWQSEPVLSLQLIVRYAHRDSRVVDVGGGTSYLSERLRGLGFRHLTVVDVSGAALRRAEARAPTSAPKIRWLRRDLTGGGHLGRFDVWHDRAVFHFLTRPEDREAYRRNVQRSLVPGGIAIVATFAPHGPSSCSGLPVRRYSPSTLSSAFGPAFTLKEFRREQHRTPWGTTQPFVYAVLSKSG